jgi:peptidoglycan hydrolase-like protein with peptidoglycan-binding domain/3D (Asp-Asp-Asp) domain-containing protein
MHTKIPHHIFLIGFAIMCIAPTMGWSSGEAYERDFVITAYYSPLPDQCCYVKGNLHADMILNGQGIRAADGTGVYPGMIAAPSSYTFGTRVTLPGIGTFAVHDRGGAIRASADSDRLDIWVGAGEEGLARALAFGVQRVRGTVYPNGNDAPEVSFALESLPSPLDRLKPFIALEPDLLSLKAVQDSKSLSVKIMQEYLHKAGYFSHARTGYFGPVTRASLEEFARDFHLDEPTDQLTKRMAAFLVAAVNREDARQPIASYVERGSHGGSVQDAQRTLRFLGYYRGRTDGQYSDALKDAILRFQEEEDIISSEKSIGAGRIGPSTRTKLRDCWNAKIVARSAEDILAKNQINMILAEHGQNVGSFLGEGDRGSEVRNLQKLLASLQHFPADKINGVFGPMTKKAVRKYQTERNIIQSVSDPAAGYVGPATLASLRASQLTALHGRVRAEGWEAL